MCQQSHRGRPVSNESDTQNDLKTDISLKVSANLDPITNATPNGIKSIFNLLFWDRHIKVERAIALAKAQTIVDTQKIIGGSAFFDPESGRLIDQDSAKQELRSLISQTIQEEEVANIIKCSIQAAACMGDADSNSDNAQISQNFLSRWKNEARQISEEATQALWGKILSEEVKSPNSISLRTLDVLRNLTRVEAEAFERACPFILFNKVVLDSGDGKTPASNDDMTHLRDSGIIAHFTPGIYKSSKWSPSKTEYNEKKTEVLYVNQGNNFIFIESSYAEGVNLTFRYWELTNAGKELYRVIKNQIPDQPEALAKALCADHPKLASKLNYTNYTDISTNSVDLSKVKVMIAE